MYLRLGLVSNSLKSNVESVLRLQCEIGQVCEEVVRVPRLNSAWGDALAMWGQFGMSEDEHRRRRLTETLDSSSVRANAAACKFPSQVGTQTDRHTPVFVGTRLGITPAPFPVAKMLFLFSGSDRWRL